MTIIEKSYQISSMGFNLEILDIQETDTSTAVYTREDWMADSRRLQHATSDALEHRRPPVQRILCAGPEPSYCDPT